MIPEEKRTKRTQPAWEGCLVELQPTGNLYLNPSANNEARLAGLGLFALLPDAILLDVLFRLPARSLFLLATCSKTFHSYVSVPDIWRPRVLNMFKQQPVVRHVFNTTWKRAFRKLHQQSTHTAVMETPPPTLFSDVLHQIELDLEGSVDVAWTANNNMKTHDVEATAISSNEFRQLYEQPYQPVLLLGAAAAWKLCDENQLSSLIDSCGDTPLEAFDEFVGGIKIDPKAFRSYCETTRDPRPLYVFDPLFKKTLPQWQDKWEVPRIFDQDFMECLQERPDYSWLLIGATRTGTNFHVDPNYTSAWNTVLFGKKKWIMFPPNIVPPGVTVTPTGVQQPDSVIQWFREYYHLIHDVSTEEGKVWHQSVRECVCGPTETVFIPAGWWHLVLNLETTAAITQNFVSENNLESCIRFLKTSNPHYMNHAGPLDLCDRFLTELQTYDEGRWHGSAEKGLTSNSIWGRCVTDTKQQQGSQGTFSFNFGDSS